mmetsp:Transcript_2036/g.7258  ORF Transcript_2036/g.7258 Transcript_2036/m.7258 type:complete len:216 (-) Transcript_2036:267-914(-)
MEREDDDVGRGDDRVQVRGGRRRVKGILRAAGSVDDFRNLPVAEVVRLFGHEPLEEAAKGRVCKVELERFGRTREPAALEHVRGRGPRDVVRVALPHERRVLDLVQNGPKDGLLQAVLPLQRRLDAVLQVVREHLDDYARHQRRPAGPELVRGPFDPPPQLRAAARGLAEIDCAEVARDGVNGKRRRVLDGVRDRRTPVALDVRQNRLFEERGRE